SLSGCSLICILYTPLPPPPTSPPFPYTTLFRSGRQLRALRALLGLEAPEGRSGLAGRHRQGPLAQGHARRAPARLPPVLRQRPGDRKSTRLNSSHQIISYAVFCLKKKNNQHIIH